MNNFEKITASPEALAEFLASLNVADSPWDAAFHKKFCADCWQEDCDGGPCPHQKERNNSAWWLRLGEKPGEALGLNGKVKDILSKAEDVILRGVEKLLETPEKMTGEDCRNLQTLVCTAGRIQAIRSGNFHSNYPD